MPDGDDATRGLELERWGTRFVDADTEADYGRWHFRSNAPLARAALYNAAAQWGFACILIAMFDELDLGTGLAILGTLLTYLPALAVLGREDGWRWAGVALALVNAASGSLLVSLLALRFDLLAISVAGALMSSIYGFFLLGMRPAPASVAASTYSALELGFLVVGYQHGQLGTLALVAGVTHVVLSCFGTLVLAAVVIDVRGRRLYRQERIVAAQKATIARQQALLEQELSHQVAERSRELGAVLARSDVTLDARRLAVGERFADRYRIVASLGAGGMGVVYEVERVTDLARLALKAVVGEVSGASAARFAREAEIGARLRHPNLISIVDVGVASGVPYLAMDLVAGGSLEAQRPRFGDVPWALAILRQIAEGLAALHDGGVVHRDLKPANVLLDGHVARISDFGISRFGALDDSSVDAAADTMAATPKRSAELTGTGVVMGTPLYMAPEGAKSARALDASADVFALGIIAHEMLTGRAPFEVPAFVLALAAQPIPAPPPIDEPRVPAAARTAIAQCLAGDPAARPKVRVVLAALGGAEARA